MSSAGVAREGGSRAVSTALLCQLLLTPYQEDGMLVRPRRHEEDGRTLVWSWYISSYIRNVFSSIRSLALN